MESIEYTYIYIYHVCIPIRSQHAHAPIETGPYFPCTIQRNGRAREHGRRGDRVGMVGARRGAKLLFAMKRNNCNRSRCTARQRVRNVNAPYCQLGRSKNSVFVQAETADMKPAWRMLTNSCRAAPPYKCRVLRSLSLSLSRHPSLSLPRSFTIFTPLRLLLLRHGGEKDSV